MQAFEGVLPNIDFAACSRSQLKDAFPDRFFPCPEADNYDFTCSQQLRQHLCPEQIACVQQGSTAWHQARSRHITGSRIGDLLGFNSPKPNRILVEHGVYHAVSDRRQAHQQLTSAVAALRGGDAAAGPTADMGAFGTLCCAWGCKHEAAALHTLLHHVPPRSCLLDSGFVTLSSETLAQNPELYRDIFSPTQGSVYGSLGVLDSRQVIDKLKLGCSLDGLLAVPTAAAGAGCSLGQQLCGDETSIKRAPPYTWIKEAGYKACVVEVKCPTPFYPVSGKPWAFGMRGALSCQPYKCMKAQHYCQAQLNMFITGTEMCVFVVWTRTRSWLLHIPINKTWLHACLHLLMTLHTRYVALQQQPADQAEAAAQAPGAAADSNPSATGSAALAGPSEHLFWYDADPAVRAMYRQFIVQTAKLAAALRSDVLPDPLNLPARGGYSNAAAVARPLAVSAPPPWWQQGGVTRPEAAAAAGGAVPGMIPHAVAGYGSSAAPTHDGMPAQGASALVGLDTGSDGVAAPLAVGSTMPAAAAVTHTGALQATCPAAAGEAHQGTAAVHAGTASSGDNVAGGTGKVPSAPAAAAAATAHADAVTPAAGAERGAWHSPVTPHWCAHEALGVHHCLVRSVNLPWSQQQPLQRDRWFLDRCDPDDSSHPDIRRAWLDHPLLDRLVAQPQGMVTLLQLLHEGQRPTCSGGDGCLSPGPVLLAMLFKMEQVAGLQLQCLWRQLPLDVQQFVNSLRSAVARLAANTNLPNSSLWSSINSLRGFGGECSIYSSEFSLQQGELVGQPAGCSSLSGRVAHGSLLAQDTPSLLFEAGVPGGWGPAAAGVEALWEARRPAAAVAWGRTSQHQLQLQQQELGKQFRFSSNSKQSIAKRLVHTARHRQHLLVKHRYQQALRQLAVSSLLEACDAAIGRMWLGQPIHALLQRTISEQSTQVSLSQRLTAGRSSPLTSQLGARLSSKKHARQVQQISALPSEQQQHQQGVELCAPERTRSAPAVLQTGKFVIGAVRTSRRTGQKVFRRRFLPRESEAAAGAADTCIGIPCQAAATTAVSIASAAGEEPVVASLHDAAMQASCSPVAGSAVASGANGVAAVAVRQPQDQQRHAGAPSVKQSAETAALRTPECGRECAGEFDGVIMITGALANTGLSAVTPTTQRVFMSEDAVATGSTHAKAGRMQRRKRLSKSCPCLPSRRRSPTSVQRPPAAADSSSSITEQVASQLMQAQQQGVDRAQMLRGMKRCDLGATSAAIADEKISICGNSPCKKRQLVGGCSLGSVSATAGSWTMAATAAERKPLQIKRANRTGVEAVPAVLLNHNSTDTELDDLLASGALDIVLDRSAEDWDKL